MKQRIFCYLLLATSSVFLMGNSWAGTEVSLKKRISEEKLDLPKYKGTSWLDQSKYYTDVFKVLADGISISKRFCQDTLFDDWEYYSIRAIKLAGKVEKGTQEHQKIISKSKEMDKLYSKLVGSCYKISIGGSGLIQEQRRIRSLVDSKKGISGRKLEQEVHLSARASHKKYLDQVKAINQEVVKAIPSFRDSFLAIEQSVESYEKNKALQVREAREKQQRLQARLEQEKKEKMFDIIKHQEALRIRKAIQESKHPLNQLSTIASSSQDFSLIDVITESLVMIEESGEFDALVQTMTTMLLPYWQDQTTAWLTFGSLGVANNNLQMGDAIVLALITIIQSDTGSQPVYLTNPSKPCGTLMLEFNTASSQLELRMGHLSQSQNAIKLLFSDKQLKGRPPYMFKGISATSAESACVADKDKVVAVLIDRTKLISLINSYSPEPEIPMDESDSCRLSAPEPLCTHATKWHRRSAQNKPLLLPEMVKQFGLLSSGQDGGAAGDRAVVEACKMMTSSSENFDDRMSLLEYDYQESPYVQQMIQEVVMQLTERCHNQHNEL